MSVWANTKNNPKKVDNRKLKIDQVGLTSNHIDLNDIQPDKLRKSESEIFCSSPLKSTTRVNI